MVSGILYHLQSVDAFHQDTTHFVFVCLCGGEECRFIVSTQRHNDTMTRHFQSATDVYIEVGIWCSKRVERLFPILCKFSTRICF